MQVIAGTKLKIEPLSARTVKQAIDLLNIVFPPPEDPTDEELLACLDRKKYKKFLEENDFYDLKYWIVLDGDVVVGITGIYSEVSDYKEAAWIGWLATKPDYRSQKVGRFLLDWTIAKAKETRKRCLRVFTADTPNEVIINKMYQKRGFKIIKTEYKRSWGCNKLTYELEF